MEYSFYATTRIFTSKILGSCQGMRTRIRNIRTANEIFMQLLIIQSNRWGIFMDLYVCDVYILLGVVSVVNSLKLDNYCNIVCVVQFKRVKTYI